MSAHLLSLPQVLEMERPARTRRADVEYYYDGILAVAITEQSRRTASPDELPRFGWQHREGCNCTLCSASAQSGLHERHEES